MKKMDGYGYARLLRVNEESIERNKVQTCGYYDAGLNQQLHFN
jgi:hypothetical protein